MTDREPTRVIDTPHGKATRYADYDASGNFVDYRYIVLADDPTVEGTRINKQSLLTDYTTAALTLPPTAVPDDALRTLATRSNAGVYLVDDPDAAPPHEAWLTETGNSVAVVNNIAYGNGIYVAWATYLSGNPLSDTIAYSTDGVNFALVTKPAGYVTRIVYGNGIFVAMCSSTNTPPTGTTIVLRSTDGATWVSAGFTTGYVGLIEYSPIWGFVAFTRPTQNPTALYMYRSPDAVTWTSIGANASAAATSAIAIAGDTSVTADGSIVVTFPGSASTNPSYRGVLVPNATTMTFSALGIVGGYNDIMRVAADKSTGAVYYTRAGNLYHTTTLTGSVSSDGVAAHNVTIAGDRIYIRGAQNVISYSDAAAPTAADWITLPTIPGVPVSGGTYGGRFVALADDVVYIGVERNVHRLTMGMHSTKALTGIDNTPVLRLGRAIGSYLGVGTTGEANPTTLTFDFVPNTIRIWSTGTGNSGYGITLNRGAQTGLISMVAPVTILEWDTTVRFYGGSAAQQLNAVNTTYYYVAEGGPM